jgi:hypothetical protein
MLEKGIVASEKVTMALVDGPAADLVLLLINICSTFLVSLNTNKVWVKVKCQLIIRNTDTSWVCRVCSPEARQMRAFSS